MALTDRHTREIKELDSNYKAVDAYLNSISPALHADIKTALSADLKAKLINEAKERSNPLINALLQDVHDQIEAEAREAQLIADLLGIIASINAQTPGAITVPANQTSAQLQALLDAYYASQTP